MGIRPELDEELVAIYRGWDDLEKRDHGDSVIDFDLSAPGSSRAMESREDVLDGLGRILDALGGEPGPEAELVRARLRASCAYLRAVLGERQPFASYIQDTLGIEPHRFNEDEIEAERVEVDAMLRKKRLAFKKGDFGRFQNIFVMRGTEGLPRQFGYFRDKWVPELLEIVPVDMEEYKISVTFASENAYWKNWISGNLEDCEIQLRINIHPRHLWYQGLAETLVLHEYCGHAVQMISWHRRLRARELPQFFGILTVHFPDQYLLEGLAETVAHFLPDAKRLPSAKSLEKNSRLLRELQGYHLMVMNNMHIIANEEGREEALDYAKPRLPFMREPVIEKEIEDRTSNPLFRCYQYVYGVARHGFMKALDSLGEDGKRKLIRHVYRTPMTAQQFEKAWRGLV